MKPGKTGGLILLVLAGLAAGWFAWRSLSGVAVTLVVPERGPAVEAIHATGTVEPTVLLPIAPRTAGHLIEIAVDEGDRVRAGQMLARLEDRDLGRTTDELAARARLARLNLERVRELVQRKVLAAADLDQAEADLNAAEATLNRATALRGFMTLAAPADGEVIRRDGEVGQYVPVGQAVLHLACCGPLRVAAEVDEEDIPNVRPGQRALLRADALPEVVFDGEVERITPKGDPVARTFRVRIRLDDPGALRIGMTVDANLIVAERSDALLVPTSALREDRVWRVVEGRLQPQAVRTGVAGPLKTEILEGLAPGTPIVETAGEALREGAAARIRRPSATP